MSSALCLYRAIRAFTGLTWRQLAEAIGISLPALRRRTACRTVLTHVELVRIMERTGMDWSEIGYLIDYSMQGADITSDLLHENYRTQSVKK